MINKIFTSLIITLLSVQLYSQSSIKGTVTDAENGETIIGCNVMLQGTTIGAVTNLDGNYEIKNVSPGTYNIIFSFISYDKFIQKIEVVKNTPLVLNVKLQASSQQLKDVTVTATRRTDTELSMLSVTRQGLTIANGITSQQIARSQDKDASEVIRRIPGVSIREGKFVIVRGLTERYNSVWLNGSSTPSSESDVRAFSFDVIPSGQIDNILIYKTPAPELPADFAGAMINIKTKSLIDKNSIAFSYSYGYHQGTTGKDFFTYQGGKTDWLGYDDGTRAIPNAVPTTIEFQKLTNAYSDINKINEISKSFNSIMTPLKKIASPDADFQLSANKRFTVGDISIGSITSLGYNLTNSIENSERGAYLFDGSPSYKYNQNSYISRIRLTALSNWNFIFGNNQKIEFRNLVNNYGMNKAVLKSGFNSNGDNERDFELGYETRLTYSGQLAGIHSFNNEKLKFDWVMGYSFANKNQPDIRRLRSIISSDMEPGSKYYITPSSPSVDNIGRLYLKNEENIFSGGFNISNQFSFGNFKPELKFGVYAENKNKNFNYRGFAYAKGPRSPMSTINIESYNDSAAFTDKMFNSISDIFQNNIDFEKKMYVKEITDKADSYSAENNLLSSYIGFNLPFVKWFNVYAGVRAENNEMSLFGYKRRTGVQDTLSINKLDFFPTINASIDVSEKVKIRLAAGKTVNRPEFREVSRFVYYDFAESTTIYGSSSDEVLEYYGSSVQNCYIKNYDARIEWYPTSEEIVSGGVFYKDFKDPIESKILPTGSGWNYTFINAESAKSFGIELDIRKRLHEFEKTAFSFLKNFTLIMNASLINSEINIDSPTERAGKRELQGQSPYILNVGAYYQLEKIKLVSSLMYNKVGRRISVVGDKDNPHVYEMPFNSLDFTFEKSITKWASLKVGFKNILDSDVVFQQYNEILDSNNEVKETKIQINQKYKPGRQLKIGLTINLN